MLGYSLDVVCKLLKAEYNRRSQLKPLFWENTIQLPLADVYTRLKILSRRKRDFRLENKEVNMYDIFRNGDDIIVLVEGSPGIGKTTFCLKIAHDWANKTIPKEYSFPEFEVVLLLKCRDIHGNIIEAIDEQLLPKHMKETIKKELTDYVEDFHYQEKVLIILDGLDELPKTSESHVDSLLNKQILPFCYVLATSRQERGIVVRQNVDFDMLLQIEGFTEEDAFEYIRKHFKNAGPEHVLTGERLIKEIQENAFLHALRNNPLNLLLLCIVFEDHEGKLPSFRTELYQIIIRCILRRYCPKHDLEDPADDRTLEEQFKDSLLVLGELAWRCLREDRLSFREEELAKFESTIKDLVARKLGLVYKEASVRKINPQHEYHFFHKTFQEYLAALYLVHKILKQQTNVFSNFQLNFRKDISQRYQQVFIFVSGILGKDASIIFGQIGEMLKGENWNWLECNKEQATFFTECLSESRNAEQVAMTLCSFIPFPMTATIDLCDDEGSPTAFLAVANACKSFLQLDLPVHLNVYNFGLSNDYVFFDFLASYPWLQTLSISVLDIFQKCRTDALCNALRVDSALYSFTLKAVCHISCDTAVAIGDSLAANETLKTVTFKSMVNCGDNWVIALEKGLSADTPPRSIVLEISASMSETAMGPLTKVLFNKSLTSFGLTIYGDMQDSLATAVGEALAADSSLKSLTLIVYGNLSCSGATLLKNGVLENNSLTSLELKVFGDQLPDNWLNISETVYSEKKSSMSFTVYPNVIGKITNVQVTSSPLCPLLKEKRLNLKLQSLTLNIWGELCSDRANDLCKLLLASAVSCVNLIINGRLTSSVANCVVQNFDKLNTLSDLSINIRGELTRDGNSVLQALCCGQTYTFTLNGHDLNADDKICKEVNLSADDSSSLTSVFNKVNDTCPSRLSLNINNPSNLSEDWGCSLYAGLAKNTALTTLDLILNNDSFMSGDWTRGLEDGLAQNTSLTTLSLTLNNHSDMSGDWTLGLADGLAKNTSLTTLNLTLNNHSNMSGDWTLGVEDGLAQNTSLTTLSLTVNNYSDMSGDWTLGLGDGLAKNTSLTTLNLTLNNHSNMSGDWTLGVEDGLAQNTSLTTLSLTVNNYSDMSGDWTLGLGNGFAKNTSLTTLSLTLNNYSYQDEEWKLGLVDGLAQNTSITTLSIKFNSCICEYEGWRRFLMDGLANYTSLTTLSVTFNSHTYTALARTIGLWDGLSKNALLTTLSITFNIYINHVDWTLGLGKGLAQNTSLTMLSLTLNNYSDTSEDGTFHLGDGLSKNTSLTTLSLTLNNYSNVDKDDGICLGNGLAKNRSLTTLSVTFNNYSNMSEEWGLGLRNGLAQNTSLTMLSLTLSNYSDTSGDWGLALLDGLAQNKSVVVSNLTLNSCNNSVYEGWVRRLGEALAVNTSLTTICLEVNVFGERNESESDLGKQNACHLTTLILTLNS